jgi:hypothetical protein
MADKRKSVEAEIKDYSTRVVLIQRYRNDESEPIEAVYKFPMDDAAAVCGFEAAIDLKGARLYAFTKAGCAAAREDGQGLRARLALDDSWTVFVSRVLVEGPRGAPRR